MTKKIDAMLDTNVLLYALHYRIGKESEDENLLRMLRDSDALIKRMRTVQFSAVSYVESVLYMPDSERLEFDSILDVMDVVDLNAASAHLACDLARKHLQSKETCRLCANRVDAKPCPECGQLPSRQLNVNDYLIVASAAVSPRVDVIYTYDFLHVAQDVAEWVDVRKPPVADGELFDDDVEALTGDHIQANKPAR